MQVINPKRYNELVEKKPHWYNYYAGYSNSFTYELIRSAQLTPDALILDPWNGSGTTTLAASMLGIQSVGIDLNPVMKIIACAKQATSSDLPEVERRVRKIRSNRSCRIYKDDPLSDWLTESSILIVRRIESSIIDDYSSKLTSDKVDALNKAQCLMYTALFNCLRLYLEAFIPSNPTWIKKPKAGNDKVELEWRSFRAQYLLQLRKMIDSIKDSVAFVEDELAKFLIASSSQIPLEGETVDLVITSPPYCTRIDYGVATSPELSIISVGGAKEVNSIRRSLMGTTTVPKSLEPLSKDFGLECMKFLKKVEQHPSKASSTYYLKNYLQYFSDLILSVKEIYRVMKRGSYFVCVVQDSFYKDVHCDLASIISDMAHLSGLVLHDIHHFESKQNMANLNNKSKVYRNKTFAVETVLIFKRA
ncbi:TPA: DNA methyltransferase [Vibrio alginolyticus]